MSDLGNSNANSILARNVVVGNSALNPTIEVTNATFDRPWSGSGGSFGQKAPAVEGPKDLDWNKMPIEGLLGNG